MAKQNPAGHRPSATAGPANAPGGGCGREAGGALRDKNSPASSRFPPRSATLLRRGRLGGQNRQGLVGVSAGCRTVGGHQTLPLITLSQSAMTCSPDKRSSVARILASSAPISKARRRRSASLSAHLAGRIGEPVGLAAPEKLSTRARRAASPRRGPNKMSPAETGLKWSARSVAQSHKAEPRLYGIGQAQVEILLARACFEPDFSW